MAVIQRDLVLRAAGFVILRYTYEQLTRQARLVEEDRAARSTGDPSLAPRAQPVTRRLRRALNR
jgi:hypothetical protein